MIAVNDAVQQEASELNDLLAEMAAATRVIGVDDLNPMQQRALNKYLNRADVRPRSYEDVKKFEITRVFDQRAVWVYLIQGPKGDEGTAAILMRRYFHIGIGPRGKIKVLSGGI